MASGAVTTREQSPLMFDPHLARTALELQIDEAFWSKYLPILNSCPSSHGPVQALAFVPTVRRLAVSNSITRLALSAVACMTLGRLGPNDQLLYQGFQFYCAALQRINKALQHLSAFDGDAILASIRLLTLFETFRAQSPDNVSSQSFDWRSHIEGSYRLVELLDLQTSGIDPSSLELLKEVRDNAVLCSIFVKQPLLNPNSRLVQYIDHHAPVSLDKSLFNAMIHVGSALENQEQFYTAYRASSSDLPMVLETGVAVLHHCIAIARPLHDWEDLALTTLGFSRDASENVAAYSESPGTGLGDIAITFGYEFFDLVTQYWCACVFFYQRTIVLHDLLACHAHDMLAYTSIPPLPPWLDPEHHAICIADHVHYFFRPEANLWGAQHGTFSIAAGMHYFSATGRQLSLQMLKLREAIMSNTGRRFSVGFLRSLAAMVSTGANDSADARTAEGRERLAQEWFGMEFTRHASTSHVVPYL